MGWVVNATPRPLYPREIPSTLRKEGRVGWATGAVWMSAENLANTWIRTPDRLARTESVYRLNYPGPPSYTVLV
jgi:hypothetical protein